MPIKVKFIWNDLYPSGLFAKKIAGARGLRGARLGCLLTRDSFPPPPPPPQNGWATKILAKTNK